MPVTPIPVNTPIPMGISNSVLPGTFYLDTERFNSTINSLGVDLLWRKSHVCPCGGITGSPDPLCTQCAGFGRYWDAPPTQAFQGYLDWVRYADPGVHSNVYLGGVIETEVFLTIPSSAGAVWNDASVYDQFVICDQTERFSVNLTNPVQADLGNVLPYSYGVSVPATGAVQVYNLTNHTVSPDNNYTVTTGANGITTVILSDQPPGTPFNIDYTANVAYVAYERGSVPHMRPAALGLQLPRRLHLQQLDIWLRGHSVSQ